MSYTIRQSHAHDTKANRQIEFDQRKAKRTAQDANPTLSPFGIETPQRERGQLREVVALAEDLSHHARYQTPAAPRQTQTTCNPVGPSILPQE